MSYFTLQSKEGKRELYFAQKKMKRCFIFILPSNKKQNNIMMSHADNDDYDNNNNNKRKKNAALATK